MPNYPCDFEIPDEWWMEAGMAGFRPSKSAYEFAPAVDLHVVQVRHVEPPARYPEVPLDFNGFGREAMMSVLRSIAAGEEIRPVPVLILPPLPDISRPPFRFRVLEGMHRFYASVAAGFTDLPVSARECFQ